MARSESPPMGTGLRRLVEWARELGTNPGELTKGLGTTQGRLGLTT